MLTAGLLASCRIQIDMTGSGLAPVRPEMPNLMVTPKPYRANVSIGVMDMGAFVTDMEGYWPLKSSDGRSQWAKGHGHYMLGALFLTVSLLVIGY